MRYDIWGPNDFFEFLSGTRYDMEASAIKLPEGAIPLTWEYKRNVPPVGKIHDIRLEDGVVSGEVQWFEQSSWDDEIMKELECRIGGFFIENELSEDKTRVVQTRLVSASIVLKRNAPGYPKEN